MRGAAQTESDGEIRRVPAFMRGRRLTAPWIDKLLSQTEWPEECVLWPFAIEKGFGYGSTHGRLAHRLVWERLHGPTDLCVLHTCDVPRCVNPRHLFLGTRVDNNEDKERKGRGVILRGEHHWKAVLNPVAVKVIRFLHFRRNRRVAHLARAYGVSPSTVHDIVKGRRWLRVP